MRCIRCGHDSKYKDRQTNGQPNWTCPSCKRLFAFEPQKGAKLTDVAFQNAINRVSGDGKLRWGAEHLYYEVCRRLRPRLLWLSRRHREDSGGRLVVLILLAFVGAAALGAAVLAVPFFRAAPGLMTIVTLIAAVVGAWVLYGWTVGYWRRTVPLSEAAFQTMLAAWTRAHGTPPGLIAQPALPPPSQQRRVLESDLPDYSFDRAVICDRARTVDLLLANNFHFENNCAVLSIEGYPPGPFETVRTMLKRNPKLQVFALHDATPDGCMLANRLTTDPAWFAGQVPVTDVGLRPGQAGPFRGLWLPAAVPFVPLDGGIKASEAEWLGKYALELAAIRPDQVLKRLFRAMNRQPEDDDDDGVEILYIADGDGGGSYVIEDDDSFSADASADDGGADSFG